MEEKVEKSDMVKNLNYKIPLLRLFIFHVFTFGLYPAYWFYRNWKYLKEHNQLHNVKPGLLTIGVFIPFYNLYLFYDLFKNIKKYANDAGIKTYKYPSLLVLAYVGLIIVSFFIPANIPLLLNLIIMHCLIALIIVKVQAVLNEYWEVDKEIQIENAKITIVDLILLLNGPLFIISEVLY